MTAAMTARTLALLAAASLGLSACIVGPNYKDQPPTMPAAFAGTGRSAAMTPLSRPVTRNADVSAWWAKFNDPELDSLVARALAGNLDRQTAASRIREARQAEVAARAGLFPTLNGTAGATHTRISENSGLSSLSSLIGGGTKGGAAGGGGAAGAGFPGLEFNTFQIGLDSSWEIDLFGGQRRQLEAARARTEEAVWNGRDTDVTLTAQVAQTYLMLRSDQARLAVIRANESSQRALLDLLAARSQGGLVTEVDAVQQRAELSATQAEIAPLEASIESHEHALSTLIGAPPETLAAELGPRPDPVAALPDTPPEVPVGLPADLLKRRPDIRAAERELAGTTADVGAATANLYPKIDLTGSFGLVSSSLRTLLRASSRNYSVGGNLTAPLFDGGRLRSEKRQAEERAIQAGVTYRKTVLSALQEVADALSRYGADQRRLQVLQAGLDDARTAVKLDQAQYDGGLADLQATLRAQNVALTDADQVAQTRAQLSTDLVALYKALGGGWS